MSAMTVIEGVLGALGCALVVLSTLEMLLRKQVPDRLHLLAPASSLGAPLVALALVLANGVSLTSGEIAFIGALVIGTGPVLTAAMARVHRERERQQAEEPE